MTRKKDPLDNVIRFPTESVAKFGFERVKKRRRGVSRQEQAGQLNLFSKPAGEVLRLPTGVGPFDEALLLDDAGDERARDMYHKAIEAGDGVADAYCNLGVMETRDGHRDRAFDLFTEALKHDPRHFESHYNLGNLYLESGDLRPARLHYEIAAELDPEFPNVFFNLGIVDAMSKEFRGALDALTRYKDLVPDEEGRKADELLASLKRSLQMLS